MFAATGLGALIWLPCWLLAVPPADRSRAERSGGGTWCCGAAGPFPAAAGFARVLGAFILHSARVLLLVFSFLTWVPSYLVISRGFFESFKWGESFLTSLFTMAATNVAVGFAADKLAGTHRSISQSPALCRCWIPGDGRDSAPAGCSEPQPGSAGTHLFDLRDRSGEFELLGDRAAGFAEEPGRRSVGYLNTLSQCSRRGGAGRNRLDTRASKAVRAGDSGCRYLSDSCGRDLSACRAAAEASNARELCWRMNAV